MSDKAMFNNANVRFCSRSGDMPCLVSISSGWDTPTGMVRYQSCRIIHKGVKTYFLKSEEYDTFMTKEDARKRDIETGRAVPAGRNNCGFVMSRAARKRGYTTKDWMYNNKVKRYSK